MAKVHNGYLLDTHTIIWMIDNPEKLSTKVATILLNEKNSLYYSMVSIWEIAIKVSIGKLELADNWHEVFQNELLYNRVLALSIDWQQIARIEQLPFYHRDPFDRMILAQAQSQKLCILSKDSVFEKYNVNVIW